MALIEIDGLPINSMVIFHGKVLNKQMVHTQVLKRSDQTILCGAPDRPCHARLD